MEYPSGFPEHLKPAVDEAIHSAEVEFSSVKRTLRGRFVEERDIAENLIKQYIKAVFVGLADQICLVGEEGTWDGARIRYEFHQQLGSIIAEAYRDKHPSQGDHNSLETFRDNTIR